MRTLVCFGDSAFFTRLQPQELAFAVAPVFMFMAGGVGRISIVEACRQPEPTPAPEPQQELFA